MFAVSELRSRGVSNSQKFNPPKHPLQIKNKNTPPQDLLFWCKQTFSNAMFTNGLIEKVLCSTTQRAAVTGTHESWDAQKVPCNYCCTFAVLSLATKSIPSCPRSRGCYHRHLFGFFPVHSCWTSPFFDNADTTPNFMHMRQCRRRYKDICLLVHVHAFVKQWLKRRGTRRKPKWKILDVGTHTCCIIPLLESAMNIESLAKIMLFLYEYVKTVLKSAGQQATFTVHMCASVNNHDSLCCTASCAWNEAQLRELLLVTELLPPPPFRA